MSYFKIVSPATSSSKVNPSLFQVLIPLEQRRGRNGAWDLGVEPEVLEGKGGNAGFPPVVCSGKTHSLPLPHTHKEHSVTKQDDLPMKSISSLRPVV